MNVIFDMDGVLIDSEVVYRQAFMYAAGLFGLPEQVMEEASKRSTGVTSALERQIMAEAFGHFPQYDPDKLFRVTGDYFKNAVEEGKIELKPGAMQILRALKDRNVPLGLASSSPGELIRQLLGRHGVLQYFDAIVSGDAVKRGKPDPEIFIRCAAGLGIPEAEYGETFVIEDSYNGVRAAYAAGMRAVMVPDLLPPTQEMYEKAVVLPTLAEAEKWLTGRKMAGRKCQAADTCEF